MSFIKSRTSAKLYGESQMTFLVQKDCVDIIFKIKKGAYLTVSVYSLSESRLFWRAHGTDSGTDSSRCATARMY